MHYLRIQLNRRRWHIIGLLLVLLAVTFVGTGNAQASCGDYLATHGSNDVMQTGQTQLASSHSDNERPQSPCNGPSCRRNSELPAFPAPPPVVQPGGDQFGLTSSEEHPLPLSCSERLSGDAPLLQHGFRQRIERPPRVLPAVL